MSAGISHVFMTADAVGGVWTYAIDLAQGLAMRGVRTTLAVLGPSPGPAQRRAAGKVRGLDLIDTGLALDWTAERRDEVALAGRRIAELAAASGADLVHLNSPALAAEARFAQPVVGACHSCLSTWWSAVRGGDPPEDFRWRIEALARGYAACDGLVAPTAAFAQATEAAYGRRPAVVLNGRAPAAAAPVAKSHELVFTAGRLWDEGKNAATLDAVARELACPVFAAGPTRGPNGAEASLPSLHLLGQLDDAAMHYWLCRARVFASLARYEPFGLSALEAAQVGCALVLSDIATFRELWDGAAIFVAPDDVAGAAEALRRLTRDRELAERLGAAAKARAAAFSLEVMAEEVLQAYAAARRQPAGAAA